MKTLLALPTKTKIKPNQPIKQAKKNNNNYNSDQAANAVRI